MILLQFYYGSMPRRVEDFRGLTQLSRLKLLYAVQQRPGRKLEELAEEAGLHLNTAREHLQLLENEGFIVSRTVATGKRGRPPVVFDPVKHANVNTNADRRAAHAQDMGDLLRRISDTPEESASLTIEAEHQVDTIYTHLDDAGFEPEVEADGVTLSMRPCKYHLLIDEYGSVVCSVHAMLIQDQLDQVEGPLRLESMAPFVEPHRCQIVLGPGEHVPVAQVMGALRKTGKQRNDDAA